MTRPPIPEPPNDGAPETRHTRQTSLNDSTTKKARLIKRLGRKAGVDVASISKQFGWLPHTTRAALSGLRKPGVALACETPGNGRPLRYRIVPEQTARAG